VMLRTLVPSPGISAVCRTALACMCDQKCAGLNMQGPASSVAERSTRILLCVMLRSGVQSTRGALFLLPDQASFCPVDSYFLAYTNVGALPSVQSCELLLLDI
jgi:hypothetical protein